jgi:hypothetical protein
MSGNDIISGRDALHRLDEFATRARDDFDAAVRSAEGAQSRRARLAQLKAEGYRELALLRLDAVKSGTADRLTDAERKAAALLDQHAVFLASIEPDLKTAGDRLAGAEAGRRTAEEAVDVALEAYETQVEATEQRLQSDPGYLSLAAMRDEAGAVVLRSTQKQEVALADRAEKGAPYLADPLFAYLWERKFRTPEYKGKGIIRNLDNWVAQTCGYDLAYMNFARLNELPDRLAEHAARMKVEETEAEEALERYEADALEADGAAGLGSAVADARKALATADEALAAAEAGHAEVRKRQADAARGDSGPLNEARTLIEKSLEGVSFPNLKLLAAQTTTLDDDRIVDALIKLRTEELQMEVASKSAASVPVRRQADTDALEHARRRFREAGLDSPYVGLARAAFEAALEAWGRGPGADGERLFRALTATVVRAPDRDDDYFGGRGRRDTIGIPGGLGGLGGVILDEIVRETIRSQGRGRWGGGPSGGSWGGGGRSSGGGRSGGGGFKTGGRMGGRGGFKTGGKF